jgi:invasion protein IalB
MKDRGEAATHTVLRGLAVLAVIAIAALATESASLAQQPAPKVQQPAPKARPKAVPAPAEQSHLIYAPWLKVCHTGPEPNARRTCFTGMEGRTEGGIVPAVVAVVIETVGQPNRTLRVTLPLGTSLKPGMRVIIDQGQPMPGAYVACFPIGCAVDYEASDELIARMKKGQNLVVQGFNTENQPVNLALPLANFAKAYDGPATDLPQADAPEAKNQ